MQNWFKVVLSAAAVVIIAGTAAANATPTAHPLPQPANPHARSAPAAAVDSAVESKYTAITPCRIADTRLGGGAIASGHTRSFYALGNVGFGDQGGSACDIPSSATAVTGSIIGVNASSHGFVKVFAYGGSQPVASFLNYSNSVTLSASGTIPVVNGTRNFTVVTSGGTTDLVIQLTGYYVPPMWAEVGSSGALVKGSRVVAVTHVGTGSYQVDFDRDVTGCGYNATSYFFGTAMEVEPRSGDANAVFVGAADFNGTGVDTYFYLTVTC